MLQLLTTNTNCMRHEPDRHS